jgi:alpha-beta hydrolase superfamily lysophospholipase
MVWMKKPKDIVYLEDENGRKARIKTLNKMSFDSYNKAFKPARTRFYWLSRDASEVDKYIDNEFCGVSLPPDFSVISSLVSRK